MAERERLAAASHPALRMRLPAAACCVSPRRNLGGRNGQLGSLRGEAQLEAN